MGKWNVKEHLNGPSIGKIVGFAFLGIAVVGLFTSVLTGLWNWLLPDLFGFKTITPLQGLGIFVLSKIIFGFGGSGNDNNKRHESYKEGHGMTQRASSSANSNYDQLYEAWWSSEGEKQFEDYTEMKTPKE